MAVDLVKLLKVANALVAAEMELNACHKELQRLDEKEMIPVEHQITQIALAEAQQIVEGMIRDASGQGQGAPAATQVKP